MADEIQLFNTSANDDDDLFPTSDSQATFIYHYQPQNSDVDRRASQFSVRQEYHLQSNAQNDVMPSRSASQPVESSTVNDDSRHVHFSRSNNPIYDVIEINDDNSEDDDSMPNFVLRERRRSPGFRLLNRSQDLQSSSFSRDARLLDGNQERDLVDIAIGTERQNIIQGGSPVLTHITRARQRALVRRRVLQSWLEDNSHLESVMPPAPDNETSSEGSSSRPATPLPIEDDVSVLHVRSTSTVPTNLPDENNEPQNDAGPSGIAQNATVNAEVVSAMPESSSALVTPPHGAATQNDFVLPGNTVNRMSLGKRKLSSPEECSPKKPAYHSSQSDDDEGLSCPICFEPWSNSGRHRLTSLKCGHIFGQKCIERWLKDCAQKCPQCNSKAKKSDIRIIYAKKLRAIDTTDLENALKTVDKERIAKREQEMELAKVRMQYHMAIEECNRLKSKVSELNVMIASSREDNQYATQAMTNASDSGTSSVKLYQFMKSTTIMQTGGCRIMDFHEKTQQFAISQPSPHATFMNGFGVKKLSASILKGGQFVMLHQKPIKDIKFSHLTDHRLLSASQDGCLRITDLMCHAKIHEYKIGKPIWSCCWDSKDRNVIYAGLSNGGLMQFDLRNTSEALSSIENTSSRCPIVSLYHIPPTASDSFQGRGGLFSGTLEGASFWQDTGSHDHEGPALIADFKPTLLPLEPGSCTGLQYCRETQHCLVTYRPGRSYRTTTHLLCELQCRSLAGDFPHITCNIVDTYMGGQSHKMLTRNSLFVLPRGGENAASAGRTLLACVGDEAKQKVHIYDSSRSKLVQSLASDGGPPVDVLPVHMDATTPMLAVLSESTLKVYKMS